MILMNRQLFTDFLNLFERYLGKLEKIAEI